MPPPLPPKRSGPASLALALLRGADWLSRRLLSAPILAYKLVVSPWMPPACRFEPTCSVYAMEALRVHPVHRALRLIAWRLWRCQPMYEGGFDPVPPPKGSEPPAGEAPPGPVPDPSPGGPEGEGAPDSSEPEPRYW
jgi:putative membrane protein insertion efficiency factor